MGCLYCAGCLLLKPCVCVRHFGDKIIEILTMFCTCNGSPMENLQLLILRIFLKARGHLVPQLFKNDMLLDVSVGRLSFKLRDMCGKSQRIIFNEDAADDRESLYCYYVRCLQLYVGLCAGRNPIALEFFRKNSQVFGVGAEQLNEFTEQPTIPYLVRSCAIELLMDLYVKSDPLVYLPPVQQLRMLSRVALESIQFNNDLPADPVDLTPISPMHSAARKSASMPTGDSTSPIERAKQGEPPSKALSKLARMTQSYAW